MKTSLWAAGVVAGLSSWAAEGNAAETSEAETQADCNRPWQRRLIGGCRQLQIDFALSGAPIAARGPLRTIAQGDFGLGLGFIGYPWRHLGISGDFGVDAHGRAAIPAVVPNEEKVHSIAGVYLMGGLAFRLLPSRYFALSYEPSIGVYYLSATRDKSATEQLSAGLESGYRLQRYSSSRYRSPPTDTLASSTSLALRHRIRLSVLMFMIAGSRVELGAALQHMYLPSGRFGQVASSGHLLTWQGMLTFTN